MIWLDYFFFPFYWWNGALLQGHAEEDNCCCSCRACKIWRMSHSFCCSITDSTWSLSFSIRTIRLCIIIVCNRFIMSRFPILNRFTWFLRFSKCFCFLMRDRLADSLLDIMRLCLRSSGSSEPEDSGLLRFRFATHWFMFFWVKFNSARTEPEFDKTGSLGVMGVKSWTCSLCCWGKKGSNSWQSQGGKPPSKKAGNWDPKISELAGIADNIAGKMVSKYKRWRFGEKGV